VVGLLSSSGPADVARAVLEACAFGLRHVVDSVADDGARLDLLVIGGSPARSALWNQIKADVLGVPVAVSTMADLAAFGAALAAGAAAGWWPVPGKGTSGSWPVVPRTLIDPHPNPVYDAAYQRWRDLGDAAERRLAESTSSQSQGALAR
jgi:sugar (pentulose or hexulose) kinase